MADRRNDYPPSVNVGKLYERTSAAGNTYISGFFGSMKITLLKSKDADAEGNPIWNLMFAAAPPRDRAGSQAGRKTEAERPGDHGAPMQSPMRSPAGDEIPF